MSSFGPESKRRIAGRRRVVKLGGSLLTWSQWPDAFHRWFSSLPASQTILIVGGGAAADAVRDEQVERRLSDQSAHWLAVEAMSRNASLVSRALGWQLVDSWCEHEELFRVVDVATAMHQANDLPADWQLTSDSISAWFADRWQAESGESTDLILLKRCEAPITDPSEWGAAGFVDARFRRHSRRLAVTSVNLLRF